MVFLPFATTGRATKRLQQVALGGTFFVRGSSAVGDLAISCLRRGASGWLHDKVRLPILEDGTVSFYDTGKGTDRVFCLHEFLSDPVYGHQYVLGMPAPGRRPLRKDAIVEQMRHYRQNRGRSRMTKA